jgi:cupin fold WbuC family metalloprotein
MKNIYSKSNKEYLLASIINKSTITDYRQDLSPEDEFIQVSARKFDKLITVAPHKHLKIDRRSDITQETWIIIEGKVKAEIFDINDKLQNKEILSSGDCIVLFRGGHSLKVLEKNTIMYEIKNGPYFGKINDKIDL